jgi:hypothetical protein
VVAERVEDEDVRVARLLDAQAKAAELFADVETRGLIAPGIGERQASDAIRDLAADMFGIGRWWHKRIVRAGPNTLQPYQENPPDRVIGADDIAFCDFGPIFWDAGREWFETHPDITGDELFAHVVELSREAGWEFGGTIAGHLVGQFPHEKIAGDQAGNYIMPGSGEPMRRTDRTGRVCHWILEVHLVDRDRQIGGFHEELLDIASITG